MKSKWAIVLAVVGLVLSCSILYRCYASNSRKASVVTMKTPSANPERLNPSKDSYRYPILPDELRIGWDKKPRLLLREAKSRRDIVDWADAHNVTFVQNIGREMFLLSEDIGSGTSVWVLYLYILVGSRWQLLYIGNGGLMSEDYFECAYYDHINKTVRLAERNGKIVASFQIGREMDLLKNVSTEN